ncbi:DNA translocase FtsK [Desulforhopalus vacuolatus]|uniref:DNA translocase FtsK n=1 Tax=Desulforhopalus vacuolatus TaxID=40414 RepID=UPI001F06AF60|nr:DNA translocase FtsK [Desulforhopalus vacuolatus]
MTRKAQASTRNRKRLRKPVKKASKVNRGNGRPTFRQEVVAMTGIFLSCFIYLSLFSYVYSPDANWSGRVGANVAASLFNFIGWGSCFLPTLILISSVLFFLSRLSCNRLPHVFAGLSGAVLSFCGILSAFSWDQKAANALTDPTAGGFVGKTLFVLLNQVVGYGGALLIFLLIFIVSLMVAIRFSPYVLANKTTRGIGVLANKTTHGIGVLANKTTHEIGVGLKKSISKVEELRAAHHFGGVKAAEEQVGMLALEGGGAPKRRLGSIPRDKETNERPAEVAPVVKIVLPAGEVSVVSPVSLVDPIKIDQSSKVKPRTEVKSQIEVSPQTEKVAGDISVLRENKKAVLTATEDDKFAAQPVARGEWELPPLSLLTKAEVSADQIGEDVYQQTSQLLVQKLLNFNVKGRVEGIRPGPVVTTYEYAPAPGVKINKIAGLAADLALGLKTPSVRVAGSVPGKAALGLEIPNRHRQMVRIRSLLASESYRKKTEKKKLNIVLGLDVFGDLVVANLAKMPHLLIAGATGSGKSVGINTTIASLLYNATPEEVRFIMIDPKMVELSGYEGIPHLLHPVVIDPKLAARALNWAVREMERRYKLLQEAKVKNFDSYNAHSKEKLPYIVIIVDELADLMMAASSKDVETAIARLAQMARAAGMHVIIATQRPSVDVLTGLIKANFPSRISFTVSTKIDSRTILDSGGAELLLGNGDMLFLPNGGALRRVHGAFISEEESANIVEFWKKQGSSSYDESMMQAIEHDESSVGEGADKEYDEYYDQAVDFVTEQRQASISSVQRRLRVGYNRAARMIEMMERDGIVGPADGAKPREVIVTPAYDKF